MSKLIISNWKMNPQTFAEAKDILDSVNDFLTNLGEANKIPIVFCPPFIFIEDVARIIDSSQLKHFSHLGAQDIFWEDAGSDTGEISGPMLKKLGVGYVIVGHSERRWKIGETDEVVNKKLKAVLRNGMTPIVCIGEKVKDANFKDFLEKQILKTFEGLASEEISRCIVAYEPVWAISTNPGSHSDTPEDAIESIDLIENVFDSSLKTKPPSFLYGGSVNSNNIENFISKKEIDGVLIGGASINKIEFLKILNLINKTG